MVNHKLLRLSIFTLYFVLPAFCATQTLRAQGPVPSHRLSEQDIDQKLLGTESSWRLTAFDIQSQRDPVAPGIRAARNELLRPILQEYRDLEATNRSMHRNDGPPPSQELSFDPKETWVIAAFDHFLVISVDSDLQLLYTEINFKISQVVHQPGSALLAPGMSFDMDIEGGRIKKANGNIVSWHIVDSDRLFVRPGHAYLMHIEPRDTKGLYFVGEQWDVSTGKAVPETDELVMCARSGSSKISGKSTREAIAYLQAGLSKYPSQ